MYWNILIVIHCYAFFKMSFFLLKCCKLKGTKQKETGERLSLKCTMVLSHQLRYNTLNIINIQYLFLYGGKKWHRLWLFIFFTKKYNQGWPYRYYFSFNGQQQRATERLYLTLNITLFIETTKTHIQNLFVLILWFFSPDYCSKV